MLHVRECKPCYSIALSGVTSRGHTRLFARTNARPHIKQWRKAKCHSLWYRLSRDCQRISTAASWLQTSNVQTILSLVDQKHTHTKVRFLLSIVHPVNHTQHTEEAKFPEFYIQGSEHRKSVLIRSNKVQHYAGIYLLQYHCTCFGCPSHPSSGVHKIVTAASGTGHSIWATTFLQHGQIRPRW